ncbi:MAG: UDP-N-acetylmuramate dehydrogenase [Actinomycetota bacterium]
MHAVGDDGSVEANADLGGHTTFRVGGRAAWFVTASTLRCLRDVLDQLPPSVPRVILGNGSNVLVADGGFDGVVIHLAGEFDVISVDGTTLTAGAGADLPKVARRSVEAGLTGFEWAVGVPGTLGGAVAMNAGGHGADMAASLSLVRLIDSISGAERTAMKDQLELGYRSSNLRSTDLVVSVELQLQEGESARGRKRLQEIVAWRRANQPGGQNCGSVFTNPPEGPSAGALIDGCGLRGFRIGSASISEKHANFIQADQDGRAGDVLEVVAEVAAKVFAERGVSLHTELRVLGDVSNLPDGLLSSVIR